MNWLMEPLGGFKSISLATDDSYTCSCQSGLNVCTVEGALKIIKDTKPPN